MISILILTKNEDEIIAGCLDSVCWSDDIHVFDSFSEDDTALIAEEKGAKVYQRSFDGYASQRNAALQTCSFKYKWILILDADERVPATLTPKLFKAIEEAKDTTAGFSIQRRDYLGKSWLKYSQLSPYYIRLIRDGKGKYHREINEVIEIDGDTEKIQGYFDHFPFEKGYHHWLNRHNKYSSAEALRWVEERDLNISFSVKKALFHKDFHVRRYHQKGIFYKIPGRPMIKWIYMIFFKLSFLDGKAGFTYATLQSIYEYFIILKSRELKRSREEQIRKKGPAVYQKGSDNQEKYNYAPKNSAVENER
ncbi:glycosyltransferase family 2 protein [Flavitalea antarctica]